ncbi:MAG TPA: HEAT repeat domain-containing protein, partial [Planctomycetota bacterium]|nr:HEAT repeat domain-containing protein [Planctomycetota bacterium]
MPHAALLLLLVAQSQPQGEEIDFGTTTARRVKLLRHGNAGVRRQAAELLAHAPPDEAIAALLVALEDPIPFVRAAVAEALEAMADERAVPLLAARHEEERSPEVLVALLLAMGRCGKPYVARRVLPFLDNPTREVRAAAVVALGRI